MKVRRNQPCPCGSGKKYKKCCLPVHDKVTSQLYPQIIQSNVFKEFVEKNNSIELLRIFSLLQLIPENQSKEFRLQEIQSVICANLNSNKTKLNYDDLKKVILAEYQSDYREDPCEVCFTENIQFLNGNNIVFPGMANDSTNINQALLNALFFDKGNITEETKREIIDGSLFILHLFDEIAQKLGYTRYIFNDEDWKGKLNFPELQFLKKHSELFEFSKDRIDEICKHFKLSTNIISNFITQKSDFETFGTTENSLTTKPFIEYKGKYYLVMPSCQMLCLNQFILKVGRKNKEYDVLINEYEKVIYNDVKRTLSSIWNLVKIPVTLHEYESIWQFDNNKYAYVCFFSKSSPKNLERRADTLINEIKGTKRFHECEFMSVHISINSSLLDTYTFGFKEIKSVRYQLILDCFSVERMAHYWNLDKLSFWKYTRAKERAEKKGVKIHPAFSILTYYKWYERNQDSFFLSDEKMYSFLAFDYAIQGEIVIESNKKSDKHLVPYMRDNKMVYLPVVKTEEYAPIYTAEEIFNGILKIVLIKYKCPIWVSLKNPNVRVGMYFARAIIYWLNELHPCLNVYLQSIKSHLPMEIILSFDESFIETTVEKINNNQDSKIKIDYIINPTLFKVEMTIPLNIYSAIDRSDNHSERILMDCVLKGISVLLQNNDYTGITENEIESILNICMPLSKSKMILVSNTHYNPQSDNRYIDKVRYLQLADTSIVLEENVTWLNPVKKIPEKIIEKQKRIELLIQLIDSLINQIRGRIKEYSSIELLQNLMLKNEALIYARANNDIEVPARLECYSKYENVIEKYREQESKRMKTSLAVRCLIEFVLAEPFYGNKKVNDDDLDLLIALTHEIINYGTIKDSIQFNIDDTEIGLLESGRIGVNHDFFEDVLEKYKTATTADTITDYKESFDNNFEISKKEKTDSGKTENTYYDKVDREFEKDWGITLPKIHAALIVLSEHCFENKTSVFSCDENSYFNILITKLGFEPKEIDNLNKQMVLETRGQIDKPASGYDYSDIFPWRYNRKQSYIRRPILKMMNNDDTSTYLFSARHLNMASMNLLAMFHKGTLKIEKECKCIGRLLAERNHIKGKEFRNEVYNWIAFNTNLVAIPHEVKIKPKGFLRAESNLGDIDILVVDSNKKVIVLVECKNTKQAKIMYDFHNDIRNYFERQIPKHMKREEWVRKNIGQLSDKLSINLDHYSVNSIIVSSYQLPIRFIEKVEIPLYSFNECKEKNFNFDILLKN